MEPIQDFAGLICRLRSLKERKRVVVACPYRLHLCKGERRKNQ